MAGRWGSWFPTHAAMKLRHEWGTLSSWLGFALDDHGLVRDCGFPGLKIETWGTRQPEDRGSSDVDGDVGYAGGSEDAAVALDLRRVGPIALE